MYGTSELYKTIWADPIHQTEVKVDISGTEYNMGDIVSGTISGGVFSKPGIGNCAARKLDLAILPKDAAIPRQAQMKVYVRLTLGDQVSEWVPKGVFFISTRKKDKMTGSLTITGYDAMLKTEKAWPTSSSDYAEDAWPVSQEDAVADIAARIGVTVDSRTILSASFPVEYPTGENGDLTMREILSGIAVSNAGNWVISDEGKLRLLPFATPAADDTVTVGVGKLDYGDKLMAVSRVNLIVDSENQYSAGDDTGRMVEVSCPWGNQSMADSILSALGAYDYIPFSAVSSLLNPASELGDGITAGGVTSVMWSMRMGLDRMCSTDISAPGGDEIDDEYPYESSHIRTTKRKLADIRSSITKTAEQINLKIEATDGRVSQISQTVSGISLSVTTSSSADGKTTAKITLQVGPNNYSGYITLDGNVDVSGQLSADALYAALGEVADLSVDRLSTSRRIALYLAGNTSDDNYIRVSGQTLEFVTGSTDGATTEQATNPNGALLYWEADVSGAELDALGYPHVGGVRVYTTTTETAWPVYVYSYTEHVKRSMTFVYDNSSGQYLPVDIFGTGYGKTDPDMGRGFLQKKKTSFDLWFHSVTGKDLGVFIGEQYTDIVGMRKTTSLDFSSWDNGSFSEVIDGGITENYSVEFDAQGRPVKITDGDGHEETITW